MLQYLYTALHCSKLQARAQLFNIHYVVSKQDVKFSNVLNVKIWPFCQKMSEASAVLKFLLFCLQKFPMY